MKLIFRYFAVAATAGAALHPWFALADTNPPTVVAAATPVEGDAAASATPTTSSPDAPTMALKPVQITVKAQRLNEARTGIQTQTGASTYMFDSAAIAAMPGGDNVPLNQVLLQAPEVAQDSFGQFHVRGEHNGLQYRLDGVILPEGISVFGQSLDPRLISSVTLVTGALPAEYGLRTAGVIDVQTKSGAIEPGGSISLYGGSHGTVQPSVNYAGESGDIHYFFSAGAMRNKLGIESPDGSSNPLHDRTQQTHAFGYVEDVLDANNRIGAALGTSVGAFQIPNQAGLQPTLGLGVNGQTLYPSANLNENQREITQFGFLSFQHSQGPLDWQTSLVGRYSSLSFSPDPVGDLLYNGISQFASKRNVAVALQSDAAYKLNDTHTIRAGVFVQRDNSLSQTLSQVLPMDASGTPQSDVPLTIADSGNKLEWMESVYLQDEWRLHPDLTINYGARLDNYTAYSSGHQLSPRLNLVWKATPSTTAHLGYSRYFSPPPFELVGSKTVSKFANTSAAQAVTLATTPQAERANYLDVGVDQTLAPGLTVGIDTYYKRSHNLIDEGQFGAPIILTPFNYAHGTQYGAEFKLNYVERRLSAYANLSFQSARGGQINSSQFNFSAPDLAYIASHSIDLDHEQKITASAGASYLWQGTRYSADLILGSGLRADLVLPNGSAIPNGTHLPYYTQVNLGASHDFDSERFGSFTLRFDVINAFDRIYEIRNGTGVGVGAPQFGPRRGGFIGVSKDI
jgi:outer membrane receptor protein involved in Fe transport